MFPKEVHANPKAIAPRNSLYASISLGRHSVIRHAFDLGSLPSISSTYNVSLLSNTGLPVQKANNLSIASSIKMEKGPYWKYYTQHISAVYFAYCYQNVLGTENYYTCWSAGYRISCLFYIFLIIRFNRSADSEWTINICIRDAYTPQLFAAIPKLPQFRIVSNPKF